MSAIEVVLGRQILDSRGNPTVEVDVHLESGASGRAVSPSGASTGTNEAVELRDGGDAWGGKGVQNAVDYVNGEISDLLEGYDAEDQRAVDFVMIDLDGTPNKARLGANAILAVSLATAKAAAHGERPTAVPVPRRRERPRAAGADVQRRERRRAREELDRLPGVHGHADRRGDLLRGAAVGRRDLPRVEEVCSPSAALDARRRRGRLRAGPPDNETAVKVLVEAIESTGRTPGATSPSRSTPRRASSTATAPYHLDGEGRVLSSDRDGRLLGRPRRAATRSSRSKTAWPKRTGTAGPRLTKRLGAKIQLVGDDNFVTNSTLLQKGIDLGVANSILIKLNQIGTLTETLDTVRLAIENRYSVVISHRSGETEDTTIADSRWRRTPVR
jgi:enolase